jgi:hypothetical protein
MIRAVVGTLLAIWIAGVLVLFVFHHGDRPAHADAIVVLSGAKERLPVGLRLFDRGYAPNLVVSRTPHPKRLERQVCAKPRRGVTCAQAVPYSTQGEARLIARLARQHHWTRVDVVTSRFHTFRAKIEIERCFKGELHVVAAPNPKLVWLLEDAALESVKLVWHELKRGC